MSFDNFSFWLIFSLVLLIYVFLNRKTQNLLLLGASLFFYSYWNINFTFILLFSSSIDFFIALLMQRSESPFKRKLLLSLSVLTNIGVLFFFKYYLFFVNSYVDLKNLFPAFPELYAWGLPLGISFYTFQILSYTIDVYRRRVRATASPSDFLLFVMFFPQLVAGPIEKARSLLTQIQSDRKVNLTDVEQGALLCLWGFFKKIFSANALTQPLAFYSHNIQEFGLSMTLFLGLLQTLLVYLDFSAYSDMARGMGQCMGFNLTINYKPFWFAKSPTEFWQRWHISLTNWIREYLVLSLRNKNSSPVLENFKIFFVMILIGVWHAPTLNWLFFGGLNGVLILSDQALIKARAPSHYRYLLFLILIFGSGLLHLFSEPNFQKNALFSISNWTNFTGVLDLLLYTLNFVLPVLIVESVVKFHETGTKIYLNGFFRKTFFVACCLIGAFFLDRKAGLGFIYFQF